MADEQSAVEQMTVLVVEPGYAPYEKTIPHELHAMQPAMDLSRDKNAEKMN